MKKLLLAVLCVPWSVLAQSFSGGFTFTLPYEDTTAQQFLPSFPAVPLDNQSQVSIDAQGHFAVHGAPIRFWGVNIVANGAFPDQQYDAVIAGRLRKMGFNLIRFHHLDNEWGNGSSLFDYLSDTRHFNPGQLNKLESLIAALKKNGIYVNMNLHVSRTFSAADGVPDADSIAKFGPEMSKGIYYFDPQMRMLNKEYARNLLTHVNPYTNLPLVSDPVMAMVELTNEDALVRMWHEGVLKPYAMGGTLTIRHTKMLDSLWNAYLKRTYANATAFRSAWNAGSVAEGSDNQVRNGGFETPPLSMQWILEQNTMNLATGVMTLDPANPGSGTLCAKVTVTKTDGTDWHLQFKQTGLSVMKDSIYVVRFSARSDSARPMDVTVMKDASPYTGYGYLSAFTLGTTWKTYSFTFRAPATDAGGVRLSFQLGAQTGTYWLDDCVLEKGAVAGVPAGEDFDLATIRRIDYADCMGITDRRVQDMSAFYIGVSRDCLHEMKSFLHDTLGVKVPVTGTNSYVDQEEAAVQSEMDYIDNHAYWDHPTFPSIPWSATDWLIGNTAMVNGADWSTFPGVASAIPMKGKPFTISEYNHPYPNNFQEEGPLFLAAYAAFHDADGIMYFDYNSNANYSAIDYVNGYFELHRNTTLMSLMPSCAYAFRAGLISPSSQPQTIDFSAQDILEMPKNTAPVVFEKTIALQHALRVGSYNAPASTAGSFGTKLASPWTTDTKEIVWNTQGMLTTSTPRFASATGFFASMHNQTAGAMTVDSASDFAAVTWLSLTSDSLAASRRSLLTLAAHEQNTNQIWDGTRTFHNNWGSAPVLVEPIRMDLHLRIHADSIHLYGLGVKGDIQGAPRTIRPVAGKGFGVTLDQHADHTMWYGIEAFGASTTTAAEAVEKAVPTTTMLNQNYPNPFNPTTVITYQLAARAAVTLSVFDVLGRKVATLVREEQNAGPHAVTFSGKDEAGRRLSSGMYLYQLRAGTFSAQRTMLILK